MQRVSWDLRYPGPWTANAPTGGPGGPMVPPGKYSVKLTESGTEIRARLCGKMKQFKIRVIPGDRVTIAVSPYDPTHGLIVFRGG